jgi:hypothetical protein
MAIRRKRDDATVLGTRRAIAKKLGLPIRAVLLVLPGSGRRLANRSKSIGKLREDWNLRK